ncbi:hypothetical protein RF11_03004 [Thelohanellus kitauei]|uniref:Uncharacterized protein n=1 Tax=Thelohanellus kitauei TaxID=669202 RepID=A0A0C2MK04_THEKT|nr:hypothetical protein RF11_03004 [Thelohanellus kitauei]
MQYSLQKYDFTFSCCSFSFNFPATLTFLPIIQVSPLVTRLTACFQSTQSRNQKPAQAPYGLLSGNQKVRSINITIDQAGSSSSQTLGSNRQSDAISRDTSDTESTDSVFIPDLV